MKEKKSIKSSDLTNIMSKIEIIIPMQQSASEVMGMDIFYNYKYREIGTISRLCRLFPAIEKPIGKDPKTQKVMDAIKIIDGEEKKIIEIKSAKAKFLKKSGKLRSTGDNQFDKQNDEIRRKETLLYGEYVFSWWIDGLAYPYFIFYIYKDIGVQKIKFMLKQKQTNIMLPKIKSSNLKGKRLNRDTIDIGISDLLEVLDEEDVCVLDQDGEKISMKKLKDDILAPQKPGGGY